MCNKTKFCRSCSFSWKVFLFLKLCHPTTIMFAGGFHGDQIMCGRVSHPRRAAVEKAPWQSPVFLVKTCNRHAPRRKAAKGRFATCLTSLADFGLPKLVLLSTYHLHHAAKRLQLLAEKSRVSRHHDRTPKAATAATLNRIQSRNTPAAVQHNRTLAAASTASEKTTAEQIAVKRSRANVKLCELLSKTGAPLFPMLALTWGIDVIPATFNLFVVQIRVCGFNAIRIRCTRPCQDLSKNCVPLCKANST